MSRATVTARGRAAAQAGMVDECVIRRKTGETVNPDTGAVEPTYTQMYSGQCRIQSRGLTGRSPDDVGEQRIDLYALEVQLPITVTGLAVDDRVEVTTSLDPDLSGRELRIANLFHATHKTARRLQVEEIAS